MQNTRFRYRGILLIFRLLKRTGEKEIDGSFQGVIYKHPFQLCQTLYSLHTAYVTYTSFPFPSLQTHRSLEQITITIQITRLAAVPG